MNKKKFRASMEKGIEKDMEIIKKEFLLLNPSIPSLFPMIKNWIELGWTYGFEASIDYVDKHIIK